jgi:hypothetical protein
MKSWFLKLSDDPNACVSAVATAVIAFLTVILTQQSCNQEKILIATEHPAVTVSTGIFAQDESGTWGASFPYKNSGKWMARYINIDALLMLITPGVPNKQLPFALSPCKPADTDSLPLGSEEGYQFRVNATPDLSSDQISTARKKGPSQIYLIGCIAYRDDLGNLYSTPICQVVMPNQVGTTNNMSFCTLTRQQQEPRAQPVP